MLLPGHDADAVQAAARGLADGELLGLPTETVYGLAAPAASSTWTMSGWSLGRPLAAKILATASSRSARAASP